MELILAVLWWVFIKIAVPAAIAYGFARLMYKAPEGPSQPSEDSQSRSWVPHTTHREGLARPRAYGKNMHHGNIVATWTDVVGDPGREVLYVVVDHGDGPTKGIVSGQVYLNDQPTANFGDVVVQERLGTMDQTVMTGFEKNKLEYSINSQLLQGEAYIFTTPNDFFDDIEYTIHFPQGIIKIQKDNDERYTTCRFTVRISVAGEDSWTTLMNNEYVGNYKTRDPIFKLYKVSDQGFNCIRGTQYDLKITRTSGVRSRTQNTSYIRSVREVVDIAFERPGKALVGIKAIATGALSGSLDIKVVREDRLVNVYNGTSWTIEYSRNRAWVAFDILTQPVISGSSAPYTIERYEGIDPTKIDIEFFYAWAQFCDALIPDGYGGTELRFACDEIIDYQTDIWTLAIDIADIGRASLYWKGYMLTGWIDTVVTTPIDLVTMDNIMAKSWKNARTGKDEFAGQIEVFFKDARLGYERTFAQWSNENAGIYTNIVTIEGVGITTRGTAVHVANHALLRNQFITNTNRFRMYKDAFRYSLGDVIRLQQRTPNWGHAYRVVMSTANNMVTLDRDVTGDVVAGDTLYIRSYDTVTEQVVTDDYIVQSVNGTVITISATWDTPPAKGNLVAIGLAGGIKLRRIIKMEPDVKNYFNITVETYNVSLFDADDLDPLLPDQNYEWPAPARRLNEYMTQEVVNDLINRAAPPVVETDMPTTSNLTWTGSGGDTVTWTATDTDETIQFTYKGVSYDITESSTVNEFIYWNPGSPTSFLNTNDAAVALTAGNWLVCFNKDGVAHPAVAMQLIHGGVIQAGTITAAYGQIGALAVVTANIDDLAVTSAKIGALAVTSAKIGNLEVKSANIDDLTVGTAKITGDAITKAAEEFNAAEQDCGVGTTNVADCTITLVAGGFVKIEASVTLAFDASNTTISIEVKRTGDSISTLYTSNSIAWIGGGNAAFAPLLSDSPGAGSYTYTLRVISSDANVHAYNACIIVQQFKK